MILEERTQKLIKEAVVHCIEIMGLKNPDQLEKINDTSFIHTNTKGRRRMFNVYGRNEYFANKSIQHKKLHKVMTFYITEETI
ncbi:MAG: hypothetical protein LBI03_07705 [Clostridiales bacterium]|jgi:hypothetical protein|nr:hypothetical protein [Clostridiales bacterium]